MADKLKTYWSALDVYGKIESFLVVGLSILVAVLLALCIYKSASANGLEFSSEVHPALTWTMTAIIAASWIAGFLAVMRRS